MSDVYFALVEPPLCAGSTGALSDDLAIPLLQAWTEEDEGMLASSEAEATTGAATHNSSKPGDLEEAKEEAPAAIVTSTLR